MTSFGVFLVYFELILHIALVVDFEQVNASWDALEFKTICSHTNKRRQKIIMVFFLHLSRFW